MHFLQPCRVGGKLNTPPSTFPMKSCLGLLLTLLILIAVIGTGAALWYMSANTEYARKDAPVAAP
jgi:hypothetical protein